MDEKKKLRRELKSRWKSLGVEELRRLSTETGKTVASSWEWKEAETVLAYLAFDGEISLDSLILRALESGKKVYAPRITGRGEMVFLRIDSLEGIDENAWGIREPSPDSEAFDPAPAGKVLILTPGLGFGSDGRRMGRGGGYYDRFLSGKREGMVSIGICWNGVLREDIPMEERDCPVDLVCCADRILRPQNQN